MATTGISVLAILLLALAGIAAAILLLVFVLVPLLKGVGWTITAFFRGIGWIVMHLFGFVSGMLRDAVRFVGALLAMIVFVPLVLVSVVLGRWSAANHYAESVVREGKVGGGCLYRVALRHPLRLLLLDGLLEGIEQRVPAAMAAAPTADGPSARTGQFDGYRIVGSLRAGGSGAKLYVAEPEPRKRSQIPALPQHVVIKSFAITDGSSLPQIIRESRALEAAKQLGLVLDHGMEEHRFHYVMPYHAGDHLGVVTRQLHGESAGDGLGPRQLRQAMGYTGDLVSTLCTYHQAGLWHKDVKPDNLIIEGGRAHLVDLGLVTPLRSAMTLTTHGTEYFRDPEMVRMALRGVKVHQVDGAKFDVYAAGAVLYFLLENTFPAHGGLSAFTKRSPEALRWIVRRSMAEYTKRYGSAAAMLADLQYVGDASDPYTVRPADLPSMRGVPPMPEMAAAVENAVPAEQPVAGAAPTAAAYAVAAAGAAKYGRPNLRVTNWWTGSYEVDDQDRGAAPAGAAAAFVRQAGSPRPEAAEQLRAARTRAKELRERARARMQRHVARGPHRTSRIVIGLTAMVVLFLLAGLAALMVDSRHEVSRTIVTDVPSPHDIAADASDQIRSAIDSALAAVESAGAHSKGRVARAAAEATAGRRVILINNHIDPANPKVMAEAAKAVARYESRGFEVCDADVVSIAELSKLMPLWQLDADTYDPAVEDALERGNYYGVVWITTDPGSGPAADRVKVTMITSERDGADDRVGRCDPEAAAPAIANEGTPEPAIAPTAPPVPPVPPSPAAADAPPADEVGTVLLNGPSGVRVVLRTAA